MKRMFSVILALFLCLMLGCSAASATETSTNEQDEIVLYYNNTTSASTVLTISGSGQATAGLDYSGIRGVTSGATIVSYIEAQVGSMWTRVSNGQTNNQWVDTSTSVSYNTSHTLQLSGRGKYRVRATYTIRGSGGAADVITQYSYATY